MEHAEYDMVSAWETIARIYSHSSVYIFYDHYGKDDSQPKEEFCLEFAENSNALQVTVRHLFYCELSAQGMWLTRLQTTAGVLQMGFGILSVECRVICASWGSRSDLGAHQKQTASHSSPSTSLHAQTTAQGNWQFKFLI